MEFRKPFKTTSFLSLSKRASVVKAQHKMNVSVSEHLLHFHQPLNRIHHESQACYWLILREIPTFQGEIAKCLQVNGEVICVCAFFYSTPFLHPMALLVFHKLLKWS